MAGFPLPFTAADLLQRRGRLHALNVVIGAAAPLSGDFELNPYLRSSLHAAGPGFRPRDAAVLVPVIAREPQAALLLTLRAETLPTHAGQIAFPGGKPDPQDTSLVATALREAREEIGLAPAAVSPLGFLNPYISASGFRIFPLVAIINSDLALIPNAAEVAEAFEVPLPFLMDPANHRTRSAEHDHRIRVFYEMPFGRHYIWGITAGIIRRFYEQVYDDGQK